MNEYSTWTCAKCDYENPACAENCLFCDHRREENIEDRTYDVLIGDSDKMGTYL